MTQAISVVDQLWGNPLSTCILQLLLELFEVRLSIVDMLLNIRLVAIDIMTSTDIATLAVLAMVKVLQREGNYDVLQSWEASHEGASIGDTIVNSL